MENIINSTQLLKKYGLRVTEFRKTLISLFIKHETSLSVNEIRTKIKIKKDKATVYRALETFEKNSIIHKVPDKDNFLRYALSTTYEIQHQNHIHLICEICSKTFCLNNISAPIIHAPKGFVIKKSETTLKGLCKDCNTTAK